jgi:hypothetical protein
MKNPWTKKNPFLSMWLSGANAVAGRARGQASAAVARQQAEATNQAVRFWTGAWFGTGKKPRRRR